MHKRLFGKEAKTQLSYIMELLSQRNGKQYHHIYLLDANAEMKKTCENMQNPIDYSVNIALTRRRNECFSLHKRVAFHRRGQMLGRKAADILVSTELRPTPLEVGFLIGHKRRIELS